MDFGTLGSQGHVDLLGRERTEHCPVSLPSVCGGLFVTPPGGILAKRQVHGGLMPFPSHPGGTSPFSAAKGFQVLGN